MKMATLATYFGLGQQTHRSLADVRLNLEVMKNCATVLFLESNLPVILTTNSWVSPNAITRSRSNWKSSPEAAGTNRNTSSNLKSENAVASSSKNQIKVENHLMTNSREGEAIDMAEPSCTSCPDDIYMTQLENESKAECHQPNVSVEEKCISESSEIPSSTAVYEGFDSSAKFLEPDEVSIPSIRASPYHGIQRIKLLHKDIALHLRCRHLKVRFGISARFTDNAGRPRLNFVVDVPPSLSKVLDSCDDIAQKLNLDSGSNSDWRPVVIRKGGYVDYPTMRLHIPNAVYGQTAIYATEICQKESSGSEHRLVFSKLDASELKSLFPEGTLVDAFFSLEFYDYQEIAGLRLVAKKLIIHS